MTEVSSDITLAIVLPLMAAFVRPVLFNGPLRGIGNLVGPLVLVAVIVLLINTLLDYQAPYAIALGGFKAPLGIALYVDPLALLFALCVPVLTLLLWPAARDENGARRQSLTLLLAASLSGLALSGDLFNIYVFYELAAVASYGLIAGGGTSPALVAAFRYLLLSALGSVMALLGIALVYFSTGTLNLAQLATLGAQLEGPQGLAAFALILIGFGVKAELFPVNGWVPEVYASAGGRVAALLAGLASKLVVVALVRILTLVFPGEESGQLLLLLGILGVLFGELAAWQARDLSRMLAWSSVGQLGVVFVAFSVPGESGLVAGVVVALHHLVVKGGLFLLADRWHGAIADLSGAAKRSPFAAALFVLFGLSLLGLPPLPGFWSKFLVLGGLAELASPLALLGLGTVVIATVIELAYLMRVVRLVYSPDSARPQAPPQPMNNLIPAGVLAAALIVTTVMVNPAWQGLNRLAAEANDRPAYIDRVMAHREKPQ